jgi:membrane fusion protein (multidrug efflux system)
MPDLYVIKDGLLETDKILLEGLRKVRDGDKINFEYEEPNKVISNLKVYTE